MWGWTLNREQSFALIDAFYQAGYRRIDAATNYPINKSPSDFRASENILLEWIQTHGISDLEIIMKVGSLNNRRSPEHNLKKSFLLFNLDDYQQRFGANLRTFMIHWDNRNDEAEIKSTLEALQIATQQGLEVGLSGIRHPEIYARLNDNFHLDFQIQVKHNLLYSDIKRYPPFQDKARFLAYGINAGGIKLNPQTYRTDSNLIVRGGSPAATVLHNQLQKAIPRWNQRPLPLAISQFNQIGMLYAYHHPKISGILIGPSSVEQLNHSVAFFHYLQGGSYAPIYESLTNL